MDEAWQDWRRTSPTAAQLYSRWHGRADREQVVELLNRASPRDCAAAGFGCTRRVDRPCRAPEVCVQDPDPATLELEFRQGPLPGACDSFHDGYDPERRICVEFSAGNRHRAVFWSTTDDTRLWIDGALVDTGAALDTMGYWIAGRYFVVWAAGPSEHPRQSYGPGHLGTHIVSVLLCDASVARWQLLMPGPEEIWTEPRVQARGQTLALYPHRVATEPDRLLPIRPVPH